MANRITPQSRRTIFDFVQAEGIWWAGRLSDVDFLSRIFDIDNMESYDNRFNNAAGDIWQHRINNPNDWEDNWIFSDKRFDLLHCDDSILLNFLCEMAHPLVRPDSSEVSRLLQIYNEVLTEDGFEVVEKSRIAGKPFFCRTNKNNRKGFHLQKGS